MARLRMLAKVGRYKLKRLETRVTSAWCQRFYVFY